MSGKAKKERLRDSHGKFVAKNGKKMLPGEQLKPFQFQEGHPGGPGRPLGSVSIVAALRRRLKADPKKVDEIIDNWLKEVNLGSNPHLTNLLDRIDGKVPDYTVIVQKIQVEVVHKIAQALPQAFMMAGHPKEDAHEVIVNIEKLLKQGEEEDESENGTN